MAKKDKWKGDFGLDDEYEECGFTNEVPTGSCISSFSFDKNYTEEFNVYTSPGTLKMTSLMREVSLSIFL